MNDFSPILSAKNRLQFKLFLPEKVSVVSDANRVGCDRDFFRYDGTLTVFDEIGFYDDESRVVYDAAFLFYDAVFVIYDEAVLCYDAS